jgi:CRP/FNR family transcriptional regulator, cyclic AMP receptor protein
MNQIVFPSEIDVDFRETARRLGATIAFPAGATIFREGDAPDHMYILLEGAIDMTHQGQIIETIGPGDALGIVSLLDRKPRSASALVTQDAQLAIIDRKNFRYMVEAVPHFVWYVMAELVDRLRATNAKLAS